MRPEVHPMEFNLCGGGTVAGTLTEMRGRFLYRKFRPVELLPMPALAIEDVCLESVSRFNRFRSERISAAC